jgi:deoxyhypusine synthase
MTQPETILKVILMQKKQRTTKHPSHHRQYDGLRNVANLDHFPRIRGYDYERNHKEGFDLDSFIAAAATTGFQASNLAKAIDVINIMRREKATIFLGCTSNMVSSGIREAITYLARHSHVHCIVTTAGGIEEDIIKCLKPFVLGSFEVPGEQLLDSGVNRTGNIFVPNDRYAYFDTFMRTFLDGLYEKYGGTPVPTHLLIKELGFAAGTLETKEDSYLYWAAKNNIPVICPALMDGSIGDLIHFFRQRHKEFHVDVSEDMDLIVKLALNAEKAGAILLGAGVSKHFILNANIFREGLDYAVYINTAEEYDGSDSGARIEEAVTWAKVKPRSPAVKVHCDATIAFPLLVAATFAQQG